MLVTENDNFPSLEQPELKFSGCSLSPNNIKILAIDDDSNFLFGLSHLLFKAGFRVITASNGLDGIAKCKNEKPDLILLDVNLPQQNGFEIKKLLDVDPNTLQIPVIYLSAQSDKSQIIAGLNMAHGYITKPIDGDILIAQIQVALRYLSTGFNIAMQRFGNPQLSEDGVTKIPYAFEIHENFTAGHTLRVTHWFNVFSRSLGVNGEELKNGEKGAILHDIGKIAIPIEILNKPGPLDSKEWEVVRSHPKVGYEMLSPIKTLHPALEIVRSHHERWDGTGYPDGLKENAIPLAARIFSIVDVFDALISKRPYKQALSKNEALFIVQSQRGHQFDPNLVDHFISNFSSLEREVEDELNHENLDH